MKRPAIYQLDPSGFAEDCKKQMTSGWMSLKDVHEVVNNHFLTHSIKAIMPAVSLLEKFSCLNAYNQAGAGLVTWTDLSFISFKSEYPNDPSVRMDHLFIPADWGNDIIDVARHGCTHVTTEPTNTQMEFSDSKDTPRHFLQVAHKSNGGRFFVERIRRRIFLIEDSKAKTA
jgi:hypothetical protein